MENQGEAQKTECPGPDQRSRFSDLKEAMVSNELFLVSPRGHWGAGPGWESMWREEEKWVREEETRRFSSHVAILSLPLSA